MAEPAATDLAALQARFAAALLNGEDHPGALFRGDAARNARRFALYRGNLTANWERALGNAYPVLRRVLGADFFRGLARAFGRARPLAEGDLNRFGDGLAGFLEAFAPAAPYPYLPDLARLEWALHLAHYAADGDAPGAAALAALDAASLDRLRLGLRPGSTLLCSRFAIATLWRAHQSERVDWPAALEHPSRVLVLRRGWRAEPLTLEVGEYAALAALATGATLGAALEAAVDAEPDFDPAAALPRWLGAGVFATATAADPPGTPHRHPPRDPHEARP